MTKVGQRYVVEVFPTHSGCPGKCVTASHGNMGYVDCVIDGAIV